MTFIETSNKTIVKTFHRKKVDLDFDYRYIQFHMRWAQGESVASWTDH